MTITAKIIADSISDDDIRLTTFELRYPRFIHAELMTHRVFSRNASSSRAIPVARMISAITEDPAMPIYWGSSKPGMQAGAELDPFEINKAKKAWLLGMEKAVDTAQTLLELGLHKQIANRVLEPWSHITVVVTATEWENFYALRCHKDAQPEIQELATKMRDAQHYNLPEPLKTGDWHLPYILPIDHELAMLYGNTADGSWLEILQKVSVARCARTSYVSHDGKRTSIQDDVALFEKLMIGQPLHASPAEHQATPDHLNAGSAWANRDRHGNFRGWIQLRKTLPGEFVPG